MVFAVSFSLANFVLYCVQQLGVTLGVGAETVLLVAYLQIKRDGLVTDEETGLAHAVRRVMDFGLFAMIVSGIGILITRYFQGQALELLSTAYLFKWSLIGIVLFMAIINRGVSRVSEVVQGLTAGTWFAIFAVHILAPEASWEQLGTFYGVWLVGFMMCWTVCVFAIRDRKKPAVAAQQRKITNPFPPPSVPAAASVAPAAVAQPVEKKTFGSFFASKSVPPPPPMAPVAPVQAQTPTPVPAPAAVTFASAPPPPPLAPRPSFAPPPGQVSMQSEISISTPQWPATSSSPPGAYRGIYVMPKTPEDLNKINTQ